ncbi:lanthionine synthetase C family protein [Paenibacillus sp. Z6-24]
METGTVTGTGMPIVDRIKQIALNMREYDRLLQIVTDPHNDLQLNGERIRPWSATTLSHGIPGLCMLYAELHVHFPDEGWDHTGHQYLSILVKDIAENGIRTPSLFSGAAGIGMAAVCLSLNGELYRKFIDRINDYLWAHIPDMIKNCQQRKARSGDYDVIEGLSGIASYLLLFHKEEKMRPLIDKVLNYLIELTREQEYHGIMVPGWHIPSEYQFTDQESQNYPEGNFNLGLSHGIPGPLIILCKAWQQGIRQPGQLEAIREMASFLICFSSRDEQDRLFWKGCISMEEYRHGAAGKENNFRRDAWCYGNPGVCLALFYAGEVLEVQEWKSLALDTFSQTLQQVHHIYSPTFCHGYAGIAQIASRLQQLSGEKQFENELLKLRSIIMDYDQTEYVFGFCNHEHFEGRGLTAVQYTGLLDGTVGTALTLLHLLLGSRTPWQQAFLL